MNPALKKHFRRSLLGLCLLFTTFLSQRAAAQCSNIDFTASYAKACRPVLVKFTATGAPSGSVYYWDFGNGYVSGGNVMLESYNDPGTYSVSLQVKLPDGTVCTKTKTNYLNLTTFSAVKFGADKTSFCSNPATVTLTDSTTGVNFREWTVDGVVLSSSAKTVSYTFTTPGYKTVSLKVYDPLGCNSTLTKTKYIYVPDNLKVDFCSDMQENAAHDKITATYTPITDTNFTITQYNWSFPGGTPSSYVGQNPPVVTYNSISTPRDVTLTVTTSSGCTASFTKKSLIQKYYSILKSDLCPKESAYLTNLANNNGRDADFKYTSNIAVSFANIGGDQYKANFFATGTSNITISFNYTNSSCTDKLFVPAMFRVLPPKAEFNSPEPEICSPGIIDLVALNSTPAIGTNTYKWRIFDENMNELPGSPIGSSSASTASYTFSADGLYTVRLIVYNSAGCDDSVTRKGYLKVGIPTPAFTFNPGCTGTPSQVVNTTNPAEDPGSPFTHDWVVQHLDSANIKLTSSDKEPIFNFATPGNYKITYTILNADGCSKSTVKNIAVSGIVADFTALSRSGCLPFSTQLTSNIKLAIPAAGLSYKWEVTPSANAIIADPVGASTSITFTENGCYTIKLTITSPVGCSTVITKNNYVCLGTEAQFIMSTNGCINKPVNPYNYSTNNPSSYKWIITPSANVLISPADNVASPEFRFMADGCYSVQLITGKGNPNCADTMTKQICIATPIAGFSTTDTSQKCAPVNVKFSGSSVNAVNYVWDFGDGNKLTTAQQNLSHTYQANNPNGYTVSLIALNSGGCSDTFTYKNYVKIYGPVPQFTLDKKKGCKDLAVNFTNTSQYVTKFYMLYGDNSPIDSVQLGQHLYKYEDYTRDSNVYIPTLFAVDATECISAYKDTIILYRPSLADFNMSDSVGCMPFKVQFYNESKYAASYEWDFDGDGIVDDTTEVPEFTFKKPGLFAATLRAIAANGCVDTRIKYVMVHGKPVADFSVSTNKVCYKDTIGFTDKSTADTTIIKYEWDFGDGTLTTDTSSLPNPSYHYITSGFHTVTLMVETANGCRDTVVYSDVLFNVDSIPPASPEIYYVTVTPSNDIKVVYRKGSVAEAFSRYNVYKTFGGVTKPFYTSTNINDTLFYDLKPNVNVSNGIYYYQVEAEDDCGQRSKNNIAHSNILLRLDLTVPQAVGLRWNPYLGWGTFRGYNIYRRENNSPFQLLASVSYTDTAYLDSNLCDKLYTYYIEAVHTSGDYVSTSNRVTTHPAYVYQAEGLEITRTTVEGNAYTQTRWSPSVQPNVKTYVLDRYLQDYGWQSEFALTTDTFFNDYKAEVNRQGYFYRVSVVDDCGNVSPVSNSGTSILLTSTIKNDERILNWNSYQGWEYGVEKYLVQVRDNNNKFITLVETSPYDTTYTDDSSHVNIDNGTCYRIVAVENSPTVETQDTSISNLRCVNLRSRIFVPNAFSPNTDNKNEVWQPSTLSIYNVFGSEDVMYELKIYDRWGIKVFETHDIHQGWDGRVDGEVAPDGVYIYQIKASGLDGNTIVLSGNITLVP